MIKATNWGSLKNVRLALKSHHSRHKLFCILILTTLRQIEILIPQIVGFHWTKIQQTGEYFWKPSIWGRFVFQFKFIDSSNCRILLYWKHTKWGIFTYNLQSEEQLVLILNSDSSDCRLFTMIKATNWGSLRNESLASMSYHSWYKLFYRFCNFLSTTKSKNLRNIEPHVPQIEGF